MGRRIRARELSIEAKLHDLAGRSWIGRAPDTVYLIWAIGAEVLQRYIFAKPDLCKINNDVRSFRRGQQESRQPHRRAQISGLRANLPHVNSRIAELENQKA